MELKQKRIWEYEGVNEDNEGRAEWEEDGVYYPEVMKNDAKFQKSESV